MRSFIGLSCFPLALLSLSLSIEANKKALSRYPSKNYIVLKLSFDGCMEMTAERTREFSIRRRLEANARKGKVRLCGESAIGKIEERREYG